MSVAALSLPVLWRSCLSSRKHILLMWLLFLPLQGYYPRNGGRFQGLVCVEDAQKESLHYMFWWCTLHRCRCSKLTWKWRGVLAIMGKPHKSVGWFKAVKKAFRSPSKEKADNKDETAKVMHSFWWLCTTWSNL